MPRVLLVTSAYRPTAIADMHRVRHLAWELPALGWDVEVLAPGLQFQRPEYTEPGADWLFSPTTPFHSTAPVAAGAFKLANMRSIGWRAWWPLYRDGLTLLRRRSFDLVYISTAHFPLFCLGPAWRLATGVPYVLDYHDPWVRRDMGRRTTGSNALKRAIANGLAGRMERAAVENAAGVVSVSPVYLDELRERFGALPQLSTNRTAVVPFAGSQHDFPPGPQPSTPRTRTIVYIGAGGSIMARSFTAICEHLARVKREQPSLVAGIHINIIGTNSEWREGDPRPLQDIARRLGLGELVSEDPKRITYSAAMARVKNCDGLLVLGVDDAGYVPSKLFTYALSGAPLLASFRRDSPASMYFRQLRDLGELIAADETDDGALDAEHGAVTRFLGDVKAGRRIDRQRELEPYLAAAMAARHAQLFASVVAGSGVRAAA
jgi:hypothetical protein